MKINLITIVLLLIYSSLFSQSDWEWQYSTTTENLNDVHFINHNQGVVVGSNGTILSTLDGGETWLQRNSGVTLNLRKVKLLNENLGWTVGESAMLYTEDGGQSWVKYSQGYIYDTQCLFFLDELNGWVCGSDSVILRTTNGGGQWEAIPSRVGNFDAIFFLNEHLGWLHSRDDAGHIYVTEDGGVTLTAVSRSRKSFKSFYFLDQDKGWACGGYIGEALFGWLDLSLDGGDNWVWQYENELMYAIHFFDEQNGIALGQKSRGPTTSKIYDVFLKTDDGGESWSSREPGGNAFSFVDQNTGWIVGYRGKIYKTTNGGGILGMSSGIYNSISDFKLFQNKPNPFNPRTTIEYTVRAYNHTPLNVNLSIYNLLGQKVATLVSEKQSAGSYQIEWDATGFSSGVYYYSLEAGKFRAVKKMILAR